ncbi:hypothetical protein ACFL3G_04650 [Planctomycetota bacterium]
MVRVVINLLFIGMVVILAGCDGAQDSTALWEKVKFGDLAPPDPNTGMPRGYLRSVSLDIYIFETPAEKFAKLNDIWKLLKPGIHTFSSRGNLKFNDYQAFNTNAFYMSPGDMDNWDEIGNILRRTGSKKIKAFSFLIMDGKSDELVIYEFDKQRTLFYTPGNGPVEELTIGPGLIALRMTANKVPGLRGTWDIEFVPAFMPPHSTIIAPLARREKTNDFIFDSAGFNLKMTTGDLFYLGPAKFQDTHANLAGYFFSDPGVIRTYMVLCARSSD